MKKIVLALSTMVVLGMIAFVLESCKDNEPNSLTVIGVTTGLSVALDGAEVTNVPVNSSVVVKFNKAVDEKSADPNSIAIYANGLNSIGSTIVVKNDSVILTPTTPMNLGTPYRISIFSTLKAKDGAIATGNEFNFKTFGRANVTPPQPSQQVSYYSFSGNMKDEIGTHTPPTVDIKDLTYGTDRFGFDGLAGSFNGSTTLVEIPQGDLYMVNNFTLSLWIKADATKSGQFVLGLAAWKGFYFDIASDWSSVKLTAQFALAGNTSDSEDNWFAGTGLTKDNGGWQGTTFQKDILPHGGGVGTTYFKDKWAHVVFTYNAGTKLSTMYLNGEKVNQLDFNLWPAGNPKTTTTGLKFAGNLSGGGNKLALGFIQGSKNRIATESWADPADLYSNHFKGLMDDVRIFKVALTSDDVTTLYAAEKP